MAKRSRRIASFALCATLGIVAAACSADGDGPSAQDLQETTTSQEPSSSAAATTTATAAPTNIYEHTGAGMFSEKVTPFVATPRVYVPNSDADTVTVIDPIALEIVDQFPVGDLPHHVVPSYDMQVLYVNNTRGNSLTPIDPRTGQPGEDIPVDDPYNLYFTPDGRHGVVMAERLSRVDFTDPGTWQKVGSVAIPHAGVNHADFTADGKTMVASCEFSGWLVRIDVETMQLTGELRLGGKPVDVKLSPDGSVMYVADEAQNGVHVIDPVSFTQLRFIPTGTGTHGLYPSRDATQLYVTNRLAGTISVLDFATGDPITEWNIGGSPDMGGVSPDGTQLWLSGRYHSAVYVVDTRTGELLKTFTTGAGAHGLAYFPQPGRFSMGHTGNYR